MFECKKILNGRGNVPEPEVHVASGDITAGSTLALSGGKVAINSTAPTHIALADAASGAKVACYAIIPGMIFDVPFASTVANVTVKEGDKVKIDSGIAVTSTTTDGVVTIVNLNGATKAGDIIQVKF